MLPALYGNVYIHLSTYTKSEFMSWVKLPSSCLPLCLLCHPFLSACANLHNDQDDDDGDVGD